MKKWIIAYVIMAVGGLGAFVGIGCAIHAGCPFDKGTTSTDGRVLYLSNCAVCHGRDGQGANGPSLISGQGGSLAGEELVSKISRGRPFYSMPAFKRSLSEEQIRAIATYIETQLRKAS